MFGWGMFYNLGLDGYKGISVMKLISLLILMLVFWRSESIGLRLERTMERARLDSNIRNSTSKDAFMKSMLLFKRYSDIGVDEYEM